MKLVCPACSGGLAPGKDLYAASVYQIDAGRLSERHYYLCRRCSRQVMRGTEAGRQAVRALLKFAADQIDGGH